MSRETDIIIASFRFRQVQFLIQIIPGLIIICVFHILLRYPKLPAEQLTRNRIPAQKSNLPQKLTDIFSVISSLFPTGFILRFFDNGFRSADAQWIEHFWNSQSSGFLTLRCSFKAVATSSAKDILQDCALAQYWKCLKVGCKNDHRALSTILSRNAEPSG